MFNNLNNVNNQNHQEVDDIFAETDSPKEATPGGSGIEARHAGLNSNSAITELPAEKSGSGKILKIILILVVLSIIGLGGYLVYSKFLNNSPAAPALNNEVITPINPTANTPAANNSSQTEDNGSIVTPASEQNQVVDNLASSSSNPLGSDIPLIPGVNAPAEQLATETPPVVLNVDSDLDGIPDEEEKIAGSNPNILDSDNDDLSDYEEIRVYKTNPIVADTDGDGYLDGAEVKSGYDPNVKGAKMPGVVTP